MPTGYDVGAAFERIEHELIDSMMRNLKRHLKEETELGFDWTQWQVQQLNYLEAYRKKNRKKYGPQFRQINLRIGHAIRHARTNGQKEEEIRILEALKEHPELEGRIGRFRGSAEIMGGNFFKINESKLEALVKASEHDLTKAEHAVLRRCDDQYRQIIYTAQVYANTGAGTVEKAVDMATHDFLARGIDSIVYKNGARHTISDYADMYIRTAERRAYLMGAGEKRKEWGIDLVIVNRRGTMTGGNFGHACPLCIPWLGKILIDDVYSGGHPDGKHELLSTAIQQGFLHPRCKDSFTTYFPGITSVPDPVTKAELKEGEKQERQEAEQKNAERQAEKYKRLAEFTLDPENKRKNEARAKKWESLGKKMSAHVDREEGPNYGELISQEELDNFAEEVQKRGYRFVNKVKGISKTVFGGFEGYRGDINKLMEILDELDKTKVFWPERLKRKGILIGYEDFGNLDDFAYCDGRNMFFNKLLYDDSDYLHKVYKKAAGEEVFVKGTSEKSIPWHEIGHILQKENPFLYHKLERVVNAYAEKRGLSFKQAALKLTSAYGITEAGDIYPELLSEMLSATNSEIKNKRDASSDVIKEVFK